MMLFLLLLPISLHAATLESLALERLAKARDATEVRQRQAEFEELSVALRACQIQMAEKIVPFICYQSLTLAQAWPKKPDGLPEVTSLDHLCATAAKRLALSDTREPPGLSAICRHEVAAALKIKAYRDSDPDSGPTPDTWPDN